MASFTFRLSSRGYTHLVSVVYGVLLGCVALALLIGSLGGSGGGGPGAGVAGLLFLFALPLLLAPFALVVAVGALARLRDAGIPLVALVGLGLALVVAAVANGHWAIGPTLLIAAALCASLLILPITLALHFAPSRIASVEMTEPSLHSAAWVAYGTMLGGLLLLAAMPLISGVLIGIPGSAMIVLVPAAAMMLATLWTLWLAYQDGLTCGRFDDRSVSMLVRLGLALVALATVWNGLSFSSMATLNIQVSLAGMRGFSSGSSLILFVLPFLISRLPYPESPATPQSPLPPIEPRRAPEPPAQRHRPRSDAVPFGRRGVPKAG